MIQIDEVDDQAAPGPPVRGVLHRPEGKAAAGIVLSHGAGSNRDAPILRALADAFAASGWAALRCDLAFRQLRKSGAPTRPGAAQDRDGLRSALKFLANMVPSPVYLGGHSYGGRQSTMLASEDETVTAALLLLSYPLHPPRRPTELRTAHLPNLRNRSLFVHGERDPFGAPEELRAALALIPAPTSLMLMPRAGHELISKNPQTAGEQARQIVASFQAFVQ